jgi:hypothetical protein
MVIIPNRRKAFQSSGATPPATDPYFSNVVLLLHADGLIGATSTTDSSSYNKSTTFYGNAQLNTASPKFGSAALDVDGAGDYITSPLSADFTFAGDFTVEMWAYFRQNKAEYQCMFGAGSYQLLFWFNELVMVLPGLGLVRPAAGIGITLNAWHHVAMCRSGSSLKLFVDGTQYGTTTTTSASFTCDGVVSIGYHTGSFGYLNAQLDDIRITKAVARYTSSFSVPTAAFPNSGPAPIPYSFVNTVFKSFNTGSAALPSGTQVGDLWLFLHSDYYDSDPTSSGFTALSPVQGVATAYYGNWYKVPTSLGADVPLPFYAQGALVAMRKSSGTVSIINSNFTFNASSASLTCSAMVGTGTLILISAYQSASDKGLATPSGFTLLNAATPIWLGGQYQFTSVFTKTNDGASVTVTLTSAAAFQVGMTLVN